MKKSFVALIIVSVLFLSGCGQTGDLYLPDKPQPSEQAQ